MVAKQRARIVERQAELVDLQAGGDVRMAAGIDVGVHADRHAGDRAEPRGDRFDARQLAGRFDVDRLQPERDGAFELRRATCRRR